MGAFAGLRPVVRVTGPPLDTTRLLPRVESRMVVTGGTATFRVGGQANIAGPGSLGADVGASAQARIRFEED
jgi:hypothetical protein